MSDREGLTAEADRYPHWPTFAAGFALTAVFLNAGFVWAARGNLLTVYLAAFATWTGYLVAHYGATGILVDDIDGSMQELSTVPTGTEPNWQTGTLAVLRGIVPRDTRRALGFCVGIALFVAGIALIAWFVRQEALLTGTLGTGTFLAGYVVAHYFDTGLLL